MSHGEQGPVEIDPHVRAQERFRQAQLDAGVIGLILEGGVIVVPGSERLFDVTNLTRTMALFPSVWAIPQITLEEQGQERLFE